MKKFVFDDYTAMSKEAASIIAAQIVAKEDSVLGLATGSTPLGIYKKLVEWCRTGILDFSKVRTVNLDEYCGLEGDDEHSYRFFMKKNFFKNININIKNTYFPNGISEDYDAECKRYDKIIENLGGIDIQLLGLGNDGHIGFNEPSEVFIWGTNCVTLTKDTLDANSRFFNCVSEMPKKALTMGIGAIMSAKKILFVVNGSEKEDILNRSIEGPITPKVPASILQLHPDVTLLYLNKPIERGVNL